jgi:hypothetical protein
LGRGMIRSILGWNRYRGLLYGYFISSGPI